MGAAERVSAARLVWYRSCTDIVHTRHYVLVGLVVGLGLGLCLAAASSSSHAIEMDLCEEFMGVWGPDYLGPLLDPGGRLVGHADGNGVTFYERSPRGSNAVDEEAEALSRIDLDFNFDLAVHAIAMCRVKLKEELDEACAEEIKTDDEIEVELCVRDLIMSSLCFERIYGENFGERA